MNYTFLNIELFGNAVSQYVVAVAVFLLVFWILRFVKHKFINNLNKLSERTKTDVDDIIVEILQSVGTPFYLFVALGSGIQFIDQPPILKKVVLFVAIGVVVYTAIRAIQRLIDYVLSKTIQRRLQENPDFDVSVIKLLASIAKVTLWFVAILVVLDNLGYNITTLIAGLGIGGIAIAFALQSVLGDIFASLSIYFDKPFQVGDFIIVGDVLGTVKHIGIKSTRIQSLWGEEIIVPNKDLTEARVKNYKRMENRRLVFKFGVTYQTPTEKLRRIPDMAKDIMNGIELAEVDRVHFKEFGDFSLNFEVMYHVDSAEYNTYMDIQQQFNFALKERFDQEGIEFAYPTQTVFVNKQV